MRTFALALMSLVSITAFAAGTASEGIHRVDSLHDLPNHWTGVAGDLVSKVAADLNISSIKSAAREDRADGSFLAKYDVEGTLQLGSRELKIRRVNLARFSHDSETVELVLFADDELVSTVWASVSYDEASNRYRLADVLRDGQRRFSLSGEARH